MATEPTNADLMAAIEQLREEVRALKASHPTPTGLVDVEGLAAYLDVSPRTVRRMVANKEVATKRVGRSVRFDLGQFQRSQSFR
jgi:excisionase family DNA binding protein